MVVDYRGKCDCVLKNPVIDFGAATHGKHGTETFLKIISTPRE